MSLVLTTVNEGEDLHREDARLEALCRFGKVVNPAPVVLMEDGGRAVPEKVLLSQRHEHVQDFPRGHEELVAGVPRKDSQKEEVPSMVVSGGKLPLSP